MLSARTVDRGRVVGRRHGPQSKAKRTIMEIYHDILIGIERESKTHNPVKRTRVQHHSNLSYDKFSRHLNGMAGRGLVVLDPLSITEKGREFAREYDRIRAFMWEIGAKYFGTGPTVRRVALDLVAALPTVHHSVLLYEDRRYANLLAATFLAEGLSKGESCIYLTFEDPLTVERELIDLEPSLRTSIQENRLRIHSETAKNRKRIASFEAMKELVEDSTKGMKPPFRIFGNFVRLMTEQKGAQAQLSVEKLCHDVFDRLGITLLCCYDLNKLPRTIRGRFVESITDRHNHVLFASDPSRAFSFDSSLLQLED